LSGRHDCSTTKQDSVLRVNKRRLFLKALQISAPDFLRSKKRRAVTPLCS
jgi:hypothetical protein